MYTYAYIYTHTHTHSPSSKVRALAHAAFVADKAAAPDGAGPLVHAHFAARAAVDVRCVPCRYGLQEEEQCDKNESSLLPSGALAHH